MQTQSDVHDPKVKKKGRRKTKPKTILSTVLVVIVSAGIVLTVWRLTRPTFSNANQKLEHIVADTVKSNKQIKNCVLFVKMRDVEQLVK